MLDHGFDKLIEDETLIVPLGRLAQLEILSDEFGLSKGFGWLKGVEVGFLCVVTVVNKLWKECEISYDEACLELKLSNSQKPKTGTKTSGYEWGVLCMYIRAINMK